MRHPSFGLDSHIIIRWSVSYINALPVKIKDNHFKFPDFSHASECARAPWKNVLVVMAALYVCLVRLQISNVPFMTCCSSVCRFFTKLYISYKMLITLHLLQIVQNRTFCKLSAIRHVMINLSRSRRWFFCHCWVVARVTARDMPDCDPAASLQL